LTKTFDGFPEFFDGKTKPERVLFLSILWRAFRDLQLPIFQQGVNTLEINRSAQRWFNDSELGVVSLKMCAEILSDDPSSFVKRCRAHAEKLISESKKDTRFRGL